MPHKPPRRSSRTPIPNNRAAWLIAAASLAGHLANLASTLMEAFNR